MLPIPLFGIGNQGRSVNVDAQERTNLYVELNNADPQKNIITLYPTPGLSLFSDFGATPVRGFWEVSGVLYAVHKNKLYALLNNGVYAASGTLLTSEGLVSISDNGTQICIVDGQYGYIFNRATLVFEQITAEGFPAANHVDFSDGRFIVNRVGTGEFYISDQYDGLTWDALNFANAESCTDNLVRAFVDSGLIHLFGDKTNEPWGNSGYLDFPYSRIGSGAIEWGLAARWSICKFMDSLIFLRKNRLGQVQVCVQSGGAAQAVSTPEIDAQLSAFTAVSDAVAFAYMNNGHPFYQITFPSENITFLFDGQSRSWSNLESNGGRHRANLYAELLGKKYVTDYENGKVYQLTDDVYTDDGEFIARQFISRHTGNGDWSTLSKLWLEVEAGTGLQTGQGADPQIMLSISKDGGHTYGSEMWRAMGKVGEYTRRAIWNRLGRARNWTFKFRITDPVKVVITQAWGSK